jgi:hypothetical protein
MRTTAASGGHLLRIRTLVISDDADERFRAYTQSQIRIEHPTRGLVVVRPEPAGTARGAFPVPPDVTIHVVTAHNPGRQLSDEDNTDRHRQLSQWLTERPDLSVWPAEGGNAAGTHREASFAIVGLTDAEACALGREFDQEAVFAWRIQELLVLDCHGGRSSSVGWSVG